MITNQEIDWLRAKLEKAEKSGFSNNNKEEVLAKVKAEANKLDRKGDES